MGLVSALENAKEIIPSFRAPFHINHGSDDYGVPLSGSQRLLKYSETPTDEKAIIEILDLLIA